MATAKVKVGAKRSTPRVTSDEGSRSAGANRKPAEHRGEVTVVDGIPIGPNGLPMIQIVGQSSEVVPIAQFANVTIGPVSIKRWIEDPGLSEIAGVDQGDKASLYDALDAKGKKIYDAAADQVVITQDIIESVVAEDRENVLASIRSQNEKEEEEKNGKKG